MSDKMIIAIGIVGFVIFIKLAWLYLFNKKINRYINFGLLISSLILPDEVGCLTFALLVVRLVLWLFGPMQDTMDDHYYARYKRAEEAYNRKYEKSNNRY